MKNGRGNVRIGGFRLIRHSGRRRRRWWLSFVNVERRRERRKVNRSERVYVGFGCCEDIYRWG